MNPSIRIRSLERSDIRDRFDCGDRTLDDFLRHYAGQNQWRHHIATTYVAVEESTRLVVGFLTVTGATLNPEEAQTARALTAGYPQVPVLRLARLAVDVRFQRAGIGTALLRYAMHISLAQMRLAGCVGLVVDAKPDAQEFYERFGFAVCDPVRGRLSVRPRPALMFLGLDAVQKAIEE